MSKMIAVCGAPGSGKTTAALKIAEEIYYAKKGSVIFLSPDLNVPCLAYIFPNCKEAELYSVGVALDRTDIYREDVLRQMNHVKTMENFGFLGYKAGENSFSYPKATEDKILNLFSLLKELADYVVVDCAGNADELISSMAKSHADRLIQLITPDLKCMAYYSSNAGMFEMSASNRIKVMNISDIGGERFVRFNSLGPGYSPEEIFERIRNNEYPEFPEVPPQESPQQIFDGQTERVAAMNYTAVYHCFVTVLKITTERPNTNKKMCLLVREDQGKMRSYSDQLLMLTEHKIETKEQLLAFREKATAQIPEVIKLRQDMRNALKRAIRAGDETMISKTKYNIDIYSRQLKKLRREINACDGVLERMDSVREKLTRIKDEKFRGKDKLICGICIGKSKEKEYGVEFKELQHFLLGVL